MDTNESMSDSQRARQFYLPAMAVLSSVPRRVERFVTERLTDHGSASRVATGAEPLGEYYLLATLRR